MRDWARFFEINWVAVYFVYGQVFFITGLLTTLLSRRRSQLEFARSLPWLAGFGIVHGLNEWGYIFKPLQAFYLSTAAVRTSDVFHLAILGLSFFCLLQFGIQLSRPGSRSRWGIAGPAVFGAWVTVLLLLGALKALPFDDLLKVGDILSRYTMAVPGSILACLGFLRQAGHVQSLGMGRIPRYLRGAAYTFAGYALAGGLMVPAGPFPPASWFNYDLVISNIGVPVPVFRSILGLAMAYTIYRSLEIFEAENEQHIASIENQRLLAEDRERIGRDLHDGIIQSIYASGLRLESALSDIERQPDAAKETMNSVLRSLNETIDNIRNYVFDLRRTEGHRELEAELGDLVREVQLDTYLEADYRVVGERCCQLPPSRAEEVVQIAREALSNAVRHADAQHVSVVLSYDSGLIRLAVSDDGIGLHRSALAQAGTDGHGLANIRARTEMLHGTAHLETNPGKGTRIEIVIPCDADGEAC